jgi:hypothetical protein
VNDVHLFHHHRCIEHILVCDFVHQQLQLHFHLHQHRYNHRHDQLVDHHQHNKLQDDVQEEEEHDDDEFVQEHHQRIHIPPVVVVVVFELQVYGVLVWSQHNKHHHRRLDREHLVQAERFVLVLVFQ